MVSGIWAKAGFSVVVIEKEENDNFKGGEKEKEESKDKILQKLSLQQQANNHLSFFILSDISATSSAFLAVPEIPPKQA